MERRTTPHQIEGGPDPEYNLRLYKVMIRNRVSDLLEILRTAPADLPQRAELVQSIQHMESLLHSDDNSGDPVYNESH